MTAPLLLTLAALLTALAVAVLPHRCERVVVGTVLRLGECSK